jgi:hypothetical protein
LVPVIEELIEGAVGDEILTGDPVDVVKVIEGV